MFYRECERSARGSVISSVKSNIFEVTGESVLMLYGSHLTAFAAEALSAAYRTPVTLDADNRLMGRTAAIFQDFEGMMNTPADKQRAWALLKKLR